MLSAVFGTVKSLLLQDKGNTNEQESTVRLSKNLSPPRDDDKYPPRSPYDGLKYGDLATANTEDESKETSSFSGKVTDLLYGYGLINNNVYFTYDCVVGGQRPTVGATVDVVAVRDHSQGGWKATRVNVFLEWDTDDRSVGGQQPWTDSLIGTITKVTQDSGFISDTIPFDQDSLVYGYKPCRGDWVRGDVTYDPDSDKPHARNIRPLREQKFSGSVTHSYPGYGHVNGRIYFSFRVCEGGWRPKKGDLVEGRMIESQQSKGKWRAVSMKADTRTNRLRLEAAHQDSPFARCMKEDFKRNKGGILITDNLDLGAVHLGNSKNTTACIRNVGHESRTLTDCEVHCPTGDVTVKFSALSLQGSPRQQDQEDISSSPPAMTSNETVLPTVLPPQAMLYATLTVKAKQLGKCLCQVTFHFGEFSINRLCTMNSLDEQVIQLLPEGYATGDSRSRSRRRGKLDRNSDVELGGCFFPGVRPPRNFDVNVPVKLPQYPIPRDLKVCVLEEADVVEVCPQLMESLCLENFSRRFSALLHLEEIQMEQDMREFDLEGVSMRPRGEYLSLEVPGLAEGRPSVLIGDKIIVTHPNNTRYDGFVHEVLGDAVLLKFHPSFHDFYQAEECSVIFTFSRTPMRRCHQACEFAKNLGSQVLFPTRVEAKPPQVSISFRRHAATASQKPVRCKPKVLVKLPVPQNPSRPDKPLNLINKRTNETPLRFAKHKASIRKSESDEAKFVTPRVQDVKMSHVAKDGLKMAEFINPCLNARQQSAVLRILQGEGTPLPYIIFGPPGTGKTVTVVEAILQVHCCLSSSRILACTPSNSAADLLTERIHDSGRVNPGDMVRLNAFHRSEENVPDAIRCYCKNGDNLEVISHQRIIICTCIMAGSLYQLGLKSGHFSHVFVDEAGQATEPECLIPAGLAVGPEGQIILAGDPMQLGPVLNSHIAKHYGLGQSFLERLILRAVYRRDAEKYRDHGCYDPLLVTKLVENYRSHPRLLKLPSQLFYHDELVPMADTKLTHSLTSWEQLPNKNGDCPLLFHGLMGTDMREGSSPSWFNPVEVVQVIRYVQTLLKLTSPEINPKDIGIITPYRKQVEKVKMLMTSLSIEDVKVGSVEEFQGQERVAMIISTVRSSKDLLTFDLRHHLGFLSNPKRFNVAITRAQALMIIVGNPHILAKDRHWRGLLRYCMESGAYTGCQPPTIPPEDPYDEESLDGSQEPDITSPCQQDMLQGLSDGDHTDHLLKDSEAGNRCVPVPTSDSVIVKEETAEMNVCNDTLGPQAQHKFEAPDQRMHVTQWTDVSSGKQQVNLTEAKMGNADSDLSAAEKSLGFLPPGTSHNHDRVSGGPAYLCGVEDEHWKMSHQTDLTSEPSSLMFANSLSNNPQSNDSFTSPSVDITLASSEQYVLTAKDKIASQSLSSDTDIMQTKFCSAADDHLPSPVEIDQELSLKKKVPISSDDGASGDHIPEDHEGTTRTFTHNYRSSQKHRGHSNLSFSSSSDLDEPQEFELLLDDCYQDQDTQTQIHQESNLKDQPSQDVSFADATQVSAGSNDALHVNQISALNHKLSDADGADICQEANNTQQLWSNDSFSNPEVCDRDAQLHVPPCSISTAPTLTTQCDNQRSLNVISSNSDNQTSPTLKDFSGSLNLPVQGDSSTQETMRPQESDVIQVGDEDEEDPEIWEEEYNISHVSGQPPQDAGCWKELRSTTTKLQSEATEKWDDYTWPNGSKNEGLSPGKEMTQEDLTAQTNTNQSGADSLMLESHRITSVNSERVQVEPPTENEAIDSDQEMPCLEDLPLDGMDCVDNLQGGVDALTVNPVMVAQHQEHSEASDFNHRATDWSSNRLKSHSCELTGGSKDQTQQGVVSASPLPPGWGRGRGRGMLVGKSIQEDAARISWKKPGSHTAQLRNPWKVGAPKYDNLYHPNTPTFQHPSQHHMPTHQHPSQHHMPTHQHPSQHHMPTHQHPSQHHMPTHQHPSQHHMPTHQHPSQHHMPTHQHPSQHHMPTHQHPSQHHMPTHQHPSQHARLTYNPRFEVPHHMEDAAIQEETSPRMHADHRLRTNEGSLHQDADYNFNHKDEDESQDTEDTPRQSDYQDDPDDWDASNHPPFSYKKPPTSKRKGRKWKYTSQMGNNAPGSLGQVKRYTTDEDFMGEAKDRVVAASHESLITGGCVGTEIQWKGAYPVAHCAEMLESYDVIIESTDDSSDNGSAVHQQ